MEHGQKFDKSLKTKDKKIAQYKKNEIEIHLAKGENPLPDTSLTARDAFDQFKRSREGRIVAKTKQTDNYRIDRFLKDENLVKVSQINETRLKAHLDKRIEDGISHRTANHTIRIVKTFLNWGLKTGIITRNPIVYMEKYKVNDIEQRSLTEEECKIVLNIAKNSRIHLLVVTALYTGMRFSELDRLQWEDIDFKNKIISVRLSKSEKFRKVPLHPKLEDILKECKDEGKCFNTVNFSDLFKDIRKEAKMGHFRFHDFRHTFAALMIKAGVDLYTLSKILGHSSIVITTKLYGHLYQDQIQVAMSKLRLQ